MHGQQHPTTDRAKVQMAYSTDGSECYVTKLELQDVPVATWPPKSAKATRKGASITVAGTSIDMTPVLP